MQEYQMSILKVAVVILRARIFVDSVGKTPVVLYFPGNLCYKIILSAK